VRLSGWVGGSDYLSVASNYSLVCDNLLDLSHARYVHKKTLATSAVTDYPIHTEVADRRVSVLREMPDIEPSPFFKRLAGFAGRVDHRQHVHFLAPCPVLVKTRVSAAAGIGDDCIAEFWVVNALTPTPVACRPSG
jgi:vanillate O-demethylase monooxygenase subunit